MAPSECSFLTAVAQTEFARLAPPVRRSAHTCHRHCPGLTRARGAIPPLEKGRSDCEAVRVGIMFKWTPTPTLPLSGGGSTPSALRVHAPLPPRSLLPARRHPRARPVAARRRQHGEPAARRLRRRGDQDRGPAQGRSAARLAHQRHQRPLEGLCAQQEERDVEPARARRHGPAAQARRRPRRCSSRTSGPARWKRWASGRRRCSRSTRTSSSCASPAGDRTGLIATSRASAAWSKACRPSRRRTALPTARRCCRRSRSPT